MLAVAAQVAGPAFSSRFVSTRSRRIAMAATSIADWPSTFENSLIKDLRKEETSQPFSVSRQVKGAHYTLVRPTVPAPAPELVVAATDVAELIGICAEDVETEEFAAMFAGSGVPESSPCWATAYGASFFGSYGGQRGDGRAISIGQVKGMEVQLKGAGVTPFSRQFDGRAVLRSCVREFLASEHMHALGVPTTRALSIVLCGDKVARAWYDDDGQEAMRFEPGAVGTRVAKSFLRIGQFELFWQRDEMDLLEELAKHALDREFAHLKVQHPAEPLSGLLVKMFAEVCERQATLVAEWLRVGYCQGNMNSDNAALGGVTLDYGPFAFMEKFNPTYNPWVGGGMNYCFGQQPQAAAVNLSGLAGVFVELVERVAKAEGVGGSDLHTLLEGVRAGVSHGYVDTFYDKNNENCRRKLGLGEWDDEAQELWNDLFGLMSGKCGTAGVDFTMLFRSLAGAVIDGSPNDGMDVGEDAAEVGPVGGDARYLDFVSKAALEPVEGWPEEHRTEWIGWAKRYGKRVATEALPSDDRAEMMRLANPKFILRNSMAVEAYEAAARGDYTVVRELHRVLSKPYDEQGDEEEERWAQLTPQWARGRPGITYMS